MAGGQALTPEQPSSAAQRVLDQLIAYRAQHGVSPSIRDLQAACGLRSPSAIQFHLRQLRAMGLVRWQDGRSRSLIPLAPP